jgi:hypothetical protein
VACGEQHALQVDKHHLECGAQIDDGMNKNIWGSNGFQKTQNNFVAKMFNFLFKLVGKGVVINGYLTGRVIES